MKGKGYLKTDVDDFPIERLTIDKLIERLSEECISFKVTKKEFQ